MTISNTPRKAGPYAGNGSATTFAFAFKVFSAADVLVVRAVTATGIETTLALNTDYTVSLNADQDTSPGGTITMTSAPATGQTITLSSDMAYTQPVELTNNGGFYPRVINDALDRLTIGQQQLAEQIGRSIKTYISEAKTPEELRDELFAIEDAAASSAASAAASAEIAALSAQQVASVIGFGAVGDGVTDDTNAINAAIAYVNSSGYKTLHFPSGNYKISSSLTAFANNGISVLGDGMYSTLITATHNGDIFRFDVRTSDRYWFEINGFTLQRTAGGTYSSTCGFRVLGDAGSVTGLQYAKFANIRFNNLYRGIVIEDTGKYTVGSFVNNAKHGFFTFDGLISAFSTDAMYECVVFEGGTGPHHTFKGGQIRGSNAAVRLGTAGGNAGIGDILFDGLHVVTAGVGIDVYGPTGGTTYNQNITMAGCQFDNCSTATVRMDKMQNFRIIPNNSTASVGITLTGCTNYIIEDRNTITTQAITLQGTLNTTAATITDTNGTRIAQDAAFRRSVNDGLMKLAGGSTSTSGALLSLYGGAHATLANRAYLDAEQFSVRSQNGATVMIKTDVTNGLVDIGNGAWNGQRLRLGSYQLWVDGSGRLRIKSSNPASDTDGTVVGAQV